MPTDLVARFLDFLDRSPTPWHAVATAAEALDAAGFAPLDEAGPPVALAPGHKGYLRRGGTILAFRIGGAPIEEGGFRVVSAHTDSPNLRIRPQPVLRDKGYLRLGVEVYGGVMQATWVDRDLGLAGQVFVKDGSGYRAQLVDLRRPLCRVPTLAIHLNRQVNDEGLKLNPQTQLPALLGLGDPDGDPVRALLAAEIGCAPDDLLSWDLCLFDLARPTVGGADGEFLFSARLDNLGSSHAALEGILGAAEGDLPASTAVVALFDHEEVGSTSARGADGRLLSNLLERLVRDATLDQALPARGGLSRAVARSWHVSADMAHAVHPAFAEKHDPAHMPQLNRGPVIKQNASMRYGTDGETAAMLLRLFEAAETPSQWFVNRADLACGSTVGPLVAAQLGMRTADVGNPMLSMHSIREMAGSTDHAWMVAAMRRFLAGFPG